MIAFPHSNTFPLMLMFLFLLFNMFHILICLFSYHRKASVPLRVVQMISRSTKAVLIYLYSCFLSLHFRRLLPYGIVFKKHGHLSQSLLIFRIALIQKWHKSKSGTDGDITQFINLPADFSAPLLCCPLQSVLTYANARSISHLPFRQASLWMP